MTDLVLIFPHQLFKEHPALAEGRTVCLIEHPLYFSQYKFHKQKLMLHRASMRAYADFLRHSGYTVTYIDHAMLQEGGDPFPGPVRSLHVADVVDDWLSSYVEDLARKAGATLEWYETPQFLTSDQDARKYWGAAKRHTHHAFYVWQRTRLNILLENGAPAGGRWSFDAENREKLPEDLELPEPYAISENAYVEEARAYVAQEFPSHYGDDTSFRYAVTHTEAARILRQFLAERLASFGPYEDALSTRGHELFHSVLSPYLNNGLLLPSEVLDETLAYTRTHPIPFASLEGFVRQLIGWREFVRMVYVCNGRRMRSKNALGAAKSLTAAWWEGNTGLYPIDAAIADLKKHAYTHHIIRLMVLGNSMTLLGIHPDEAYRWFMEWYIDAYDWVMVPNVYGMALYADSGTMVTKPYISGSRYILSMSDYPKGEWTREWDALYWAFVGRHRELLAANPRTALAAASFGRLTSERMQEHQALSAAVCARITA